MRLVFGHCRLSGSHTIPDKQCWFQVKSQTLPVKMDKDILLKRKQSRVLSTDLTIIDDTNFHTDLHDFSNWTGRPLTPTEMNVSSKKKRKANF